MSFLNPFRVAMRFTRSHQSSQWYKFHHHYPKDPKVEEEKNLSTFPLPSSQFHFSLQSSECVLHKILTLPLLSSYHCKYQHSPSFRSTSRKDRLERLSPTVLSEVAAILPHTHGIQLLGWGNPRGEWREQTRPTDRSLSRVSQAGLCERM